MIDDHFDRELSFHDIARGLPLDRIAASLRMLSGIPVAIEDIDGTHLAGESFTDQVNSLKVPVKLEIEPIAYVRVPANEMRAGAAAAALIQFIAQARAQVVRSGTLHAEAMSADYEQLREQNVALKASETRYRELAEELEERVKAQVHLLDERQRQLYQAERLASVGQLAAGVAHEINNPIGFIHSNLETARSYLQRLDALKTALPPNSPLESSWQRLDLDFVLADFADLLKDSIGGADRIARIVKDLKGFSNVDQPSEEEVDLNQQLASVVAVMRGQTPPGVRIIEEYGSLPRLLCLPGHLNQVFINVLTNAIQSLDGKDTNPEIHLRTQCDPQSIVIEIRDNGCGIAADVLPRVFDPFFTTRPVGRGTGLGLTVSRDIVAAHGGTISIDSRPGTGTAATIRLPR